ncbi:MAG TPA: hypothetical protein VMQ65_05185 [Candidatus Limnocylindria bacterium]|nr:hypothetical protein [Candidatus Limnocylindria bacterium]
MTIRELLIRVIGALEAEGIPYMLTGSLASSLYGEPRATNDVDVVIDPSPVALDRLVGRLQQDELYVDLDAARAALRERGQFNALILDTKVDFIIQKEGPFAAVAFERRRRVRGSEIDADVVSPEDLILTKLAWAAETGSDRQLRDVAGMVALVENLDRAHIELWAGRLGLVDAWQRLDAEDGPR